MPPVQSATYRQIVPYVYGSRRLGINALETDLVGTTPPQVMNFVHTEHELGKKYYEFTNHLGNVLTVITDKKTAQDNDGDNMVDYTSTDLRAVMNYSPFGAQIYEWKSKEYRFGFNGKEKDEDIKGGKGNSYDYGARFYDPSVGRWLSVDALLKKYPWLAPYTHASNNPIYWMDIDGRDLYGANDGDRQIVNQSVALVLGDAQDVFKFAGNKLEFNQNYDPSKFSAEQNKFIEEFNKTIVSNTDIKVYVHFADQGVNVGDNKKVKLGKFEPEYTEKTAQNVVDLYVNPNEKSQKGVIFDDLTSEGKEQIKDLTKNKKAEIEKKDAPMIALLHGIGHALQFAKGREGADSERKTVGFENFIRKIVGLPERAGETHGYAPGTQGSDPDFE